MTLSIAKTVMRVVGTLAGLLGVAMLCFMPFMLFHSITERNPWMIVLAIFPLALALYFIYVAYLVWFRFSPLAMRHICGALGFYVLMLLTKLFDRDLDTTWAPSAFLGCLVIVYFAYRVASNRLSRWLFPESISSPVADR
jgi:hypothetical protein